MIARERSAGCGGNETAVGQEFSETSATPAADRPALSIVQLGDPAACRLHVVGEADAERCSAERLARFGGAISGVTHQLNNPLTSIKGFAQLMLMGDPSPDDREALHTVAQEVDRAATIVSDLRQMALQAQAEERPHKGVNLNEVVRHAVRLRGYTGHHRQPTWLEDFSDSLPFVAGSRTEVEQAVLALLAGADQLMEAATPGTRLVVRTWTAHPGVLLEVADHTHPRGSTPHVRYFDPFEAGGRDDDDPTPLQVSSP